MSAIRVFRLLPRTAEKTLKIHFSKPENGGGPIEHIYYPMFNNDAVIVFRASDSKYAEGNSKLQIHCILGLRWLYTLRCIVDLFCFLYEIEMLVAMVTKVVKIRVNVNKIRYIYVNILADNVRLCTTLSLSQTPDRKTRLVAMEA